MTTPRHKFHATLACLLAGLCGFAMASQGQSPPTLPITVEAIGFGIPDAEKSEDQLRSEAIADALKNAAWQGHANIDLWMGLENARIKERKIRVRTTGSAELSRIIEAGLATNSTAVVYRVRIEANVRPTPETDTEEATTSDTPRLVWSVSFNRDSARAKVIEEALSECLSSYGISLEEPLAGPGAVLLQIDLSQASESVVEVHWEMEKKSPSKSTGTIATDRFKGSRVISNPDQPSKELTRLAAAIAHDAALLGISL